MHRATDPSAAQRLIHTGEIARDLVAGIPGSALLVVDRDLELVFAEGDASSSRGHGQSCGKRLEEILDTEDWRRLRPRYEAALAGEPQCFEYTAARDASVHRVTLAPVRGHGEMLGALVLSQDVTEPAEQARLIAESERLLRSEIEALAEGVLVLDLAGQPVRANAAAREILGIDEFTVREGDADWWTQLAARRSDSSEALDAGRTALASGVAVRDVQVAIDRRDGRTAYLSVNYVPLRGPEGRAHGMLVSFRDVTSTVLEAERNAELEQRLREAHDVAAISSWELTPATGEVTIFQSQRRPEGETGAPEAHDGLCAWLADPCQNELAGLLAALEQGAEETVIRHRHPVAGQPRWIETRARAIRDQQGVLSCVRGTSQDVTEQELARHELRRARDHLQAVTDSVGEGLFTLDAAGCLTYVNPAAQEILGWSGEELRGRMVQELTHAREPDGAELQGQECPLLRACNAAETIRSEADLFMRRDGRRVPVAYTAAPLLTADGVEGCVVVFQDISERKEREEALRREAEALVWIQRIKDALAEDRFQLYAQPIIDLRTREVVQRELLVRMDGPDGVIGASEFLPIAEKYGLIEEIDRWVIRRAMELAAGGVAIEINVSAASISNRRIVAHIERCLSDSRVEPGLVLFEITETALIQDEEAGRDFVEALHALGCGIALDDFGTGYGGFTYLKQLPVDCLKIDVEFVRDLPSSTSSRHVVEAIIALAQAFEIKTVAEGVEDAATLELLCGLGVDFAQGYHIDGPRPYERPAPAGAAGAPARALLGSDPAVISAKANRPAPARGAQLRSARADDSSSVHAESVTDRR